jgi:hypothetical protein
MHPNIGSKKNQDAIDAKLQAAADETVELTSEEHARRTAEKAALMGKRSSKPVAAPATPVAVGGEYVKDRAIEKSDIVNVLAFLGSRPDEARKQYDEERRDKLAAEAAPFIETIKSSMTSHGILKKQHHARAEAVANQNWPAVYKATPQRLTWVDNIRDHRDVNKDALWRLEQTAKAAASVLNSTFGDPQPSGGDMDTVSAVQAVTAVENFLKFGGWLHRGTDTISPDWKRAFAHLKVWADRSKAIADAARVAVDRFVAAEENAKAVLAGVEAQVVAPTPTREPLPAELQVPRQPPAFEWSGDVRSYGDELAAHAEKTKAYQPTIRPGSVGRGQVYGPSGETN